MADRNIIGFGLPTMYGSLPVALVRRAATEPVASITPSLLGPVASGLVAMNFEPAFMNLAALVKLSKLRFRVSPSTTYSGLDSVRT